MTSPSKHSDGCTEIFQRHDRLLQLHLRTFDFEDLMLEDEAENMKTSMLSLKIDDMESASA